jgi:hypothetical protein
MTMSVAPSCVTVELTSSQGFPGNRSLSAVGGIGCVFSHTAGEICIRWMSDPMHHHLVRGNPHGKPQQYAVMVLLRL